MKISFVGQTPLYLSKERGEQIKQQLLVGAEYFEIDGNLYKSSTITAITNEYDPALRGQDVDVKRLAAPKHERAEKHSAGYQKYLQRRAELHL